VTKLTEGKKKEEEALTLLPIRNSNSKLLLFLSSFWDFWGPIAITFLLYAGIKNLVAEARYIPSGSMLPTLQINDRLIIEKLSYRNRSPQRGEVVVFNSPHSFDKTLLALRTKPLPSPFKCAVIGFPLVNLFSGVGDPACNAYIKRVVAIGGDSVLVNFRGEVFVNNKMIKEPYVRNFCSIKKVDRGNCRFVEKEIPLNHVFVLGDNRANSWDGRFWPENGLLPETEIIGRAVWRFWPLSRTSNITSHK